MMMVDKLSIIVNIIDLAIQNITGVNKIAKITSVLKSIKSQITVSSETAIVCASASSKAKNDNGSIFIHALAIACKSFFLTQVVGI